MDVILNQTSADGVSQDPLRFIFWLVLMAAVAGIMSYIIYVAWQGERRMRRDEQEAKRRNESTPDSTARRAERRGNS